MREKHGCGTPGTLAKTVPAVQPCVDDRGRCKPAEATMLQWVYSTVTDFARLRGWSTSVPIATAV